MKGIDSLLCRPQSKVDRYFLSRMNVTMWLQGVTMVLHILVWSIYFIRRQKIVRWLYEPGCHYVIAGVSLRDCSVLPLVRILVLVHILVWFIYIFVFTRWVVNGCHYVWLQGCHYVCLQCFATGPYTSPGPYTSFTSPWLSHNLFWEINPDKMYMGRLECVGAFGYMSEICSNFDEKMKWNMKILPWVFWKRGLLSSPRSES